MKKYIMGFVSCAILFSATVFAQTLVVKENSFPIIVDGKESTLKAYNIDGSTYLMLRDTGKVVELLDAKFLYGQAKAEITFKDYDNSGFNTKTIKIY